MRNALLRERTERETQHVVMASVLGSKTCLVKQHGALRLGTIAEIQLTRKLELDKLHNACVLRKAVAEFLQERLTTLGVEIQANPCVLLQNVLERIVLRNNALCVEGVHIRHLELVRESLHEHLLRDALHTNADLLIRRHVREVLGSALRDPLLQRLAEVCRPRPDRKLTHDILILLLAEHTPHTAILRHGSLESTHPRLKRCLLESRRIPSQPRTNRRLENLRIARRHECRVTRTNATRAIHEKHRKHRSLELRLHENAVVVAILEDAEVVSRHELLDLGLEIGVNVARARRILAALKTGTKLSLRNEPRKIVAAHEVLRHTDDRLIERRLTVVVTRMLADLARELSHTDLRREIALERSLQNLPLRGLETVHDGRDRALEIVVGEVDEILVDELFLRKRLARRNHCLRILPTKPFLAVIRTRLVKRQVDGGIAFRSVGERHLLETLEVLLRFVASRGTQSLVVLDLPALPQSLLPVLVLHDILERQDLLALRCLDNRSRHVGEEPRDGDELMPELVEEVDEKTPDVRAILVLIRHDHHGAVAKARETGLLGTTHETQDLLEFGDLLRMLNASIRSVLDVEELATKRLDAVVLALFLRETGESHRLSRISLRENERTLLALNGARLESIIELRDARDTALLLAVRLGVVLAILCRLSLEDVVDDGELADDLLEEVIRERARSRTGENLLRLRGERRVLHETLDKDREVILDETGLDLGLLFGFQVFDDMSCDLVDDAVHVLTTLRPDAVDERHREELVGGRSRNRDIPVLLRRVDDDGSLFGKLHRSVGLEITGRNERTVPLDLDLLADRHRQVVDTTLDKLENGFRNLRPLEASQIGSPRDLDLGLVLAGGDLGLLHDAHVVAEGLDVLALTGAVDDRDRHLLREDVDELDSVAVLTADELLLLLIVVRGGQEFTEDHLRNVDLVLRVLFDIDRLAVVADGQNAILPIDLDELDGVLRLALAKTDDLIVSIDEKFIDELVEARADRTFVRHELFALDDLDLLRMGVDAANVGIGEFENMFTMRELLVLVAEGRHCNPCSRFL